MQPKTFTFAMIATCVAVAVFAALAHALGVTDLAWIIAGLSVMLGTFAAGRLQGDAQLKNEDALGSGSGVATAGTGLDLGLTSKADFDGAELLIESPALAVTEAYASSTFTYDVYHDDASDFGTEELLHDNALVVTAGSGSGAAAATKRVALPTNVKRYVRVKCTHNSSLDPSAKKFTTSIRT